MQRHHLEVVPRRGVDLCPTRDQQPRGFEAPEEARKSERLEAVLGPRVRERRILVDQVTQTLRSPDRRGLEDVELGVGGQKLVGARLVSPIDGLEQL